MSKISKAIAVLGVVAGLGVAALPLSSYAVSDTANTTAQAIVGDSIAITVADATVTMNNVMANQDVNEASTSVTIQTNSATGYTLSIKDADTETALKTTDGSGTESGIGAGIPTKGKNAWGFKVSTDSANVSLEDGAGDYQALKTNQRATDLASSNKASANEGDVITLTFGVTVDTTIAAGTYQDTVVLTATTN